jgi:hypothetical protein
MAMRRSVPTWSDPVSSAAYFQIPALSYPDNRVPTSAAV